MIPSRPVGRLMVAVLLAVPGATASPVGAQRPAAAPVLAELVADRSSIRPGEHFRAAVRLVPRPGWHIYWHTPGESGLPTVVRWSLPAGVETRGTSWPYPERIERAGIVTYGYTSELLLPVTIHVPESARAGDDLTIRASVRWGACDDVCIPGDAELLLRLRIARGPAAPSPWARSIADAVARAPRPGDPLRPTAVALGDRLLLSLGPVQRDLDLRRVRFVAAAPGIDHGARQVASLRDGVLTLELRRDERDFPPARLVGVLVHPAGWDQDGRSPALSLDLPILPRPEESKP